MKNAIIFVSVLVTVLGSFTLFAAASAAIDAPAEVRAQRAVDEPAELPAEWRWKREPVRFDHMYMRRDASARRLGLGR